MVGPGGRIWLAEPGLRGSRGMGSVSQAAGNLLGRIADRLLAVAVSLFGNAGKSGTALHPGMLSRHPCVGSVSIGGENRKREARSATKPGVNRSYGNGSGRVRRAVQWLRDSPRDRPWPGI